jgi:hypothetical protein
MPSAAEDGDCLPKRFPRVLSVATLHREGEVGATQVARLLTSLAYKLDYDATPVVIVEEGAVVVRDFIVHVAGELVGGLGYLTCFSLIPEMGQL